MEGKQLLDYSLRITLMSTVLTAAAPLAATFVDGLFVGNLLGGDAFNAINIIMPISNFITVLTLICSMGGSVLAAKSLARRDMMKARKIFTVSLLSAFVVAWNCAASSTANTSASHVCPLLPTRSTSPSISFPMASA